MKNMVEYTDVSIYNINININIVSSIIQYVFLKITNLYKII